MLLKREKDRIISELKHFKYALKLQNEYIDNLATIERFRKIIINDYPIYKRTDIYAFLNSEINPDLRDMYSFEFNGKIENFECIMWYDGPLIYESIETSKSLFFQQFCGQYSEYFLVYAKYNDTKPYFDKYGYKAYGIMPAEGIKVLTVVEFNDDILRVKDTELMDRYPEKFI